MMRLDEVRPARCSAIARWNPPDYKPRDFAGSVSTHIGNIIFQAELCEKGATAGEKLVNLLWSMGVGVQLFDHNKLCLLEV